MTKKESAEKIIDQQGSCKGIRCKECFHKKECTWGAAGKLEAARIFLEKSSLFPFHFTFPKRKPSRPPSTIIWQSPVFEDMPIGISLYNHNPGKTRQEFLFRPKTDYILRVENGVFTMKEAQN